MRLEVLNGDGSASAEGVEPTRYQIAAWIAAYTAIALKDGIRPRLDPRPAPKFYIL